KGRHISSQILLQRSCLGTCESCRYAGEPSNTPCTGRRVSATISRRMNEAPSVDHLQAEFGLTGIVQFERGQGGLPCVRIRTRHAQAVVYLHGAHVTQYIVGGRDLLFVSERSHFESGTPIRGG